MSLNCNFQPLQYSRGSENRFSAASVRELGVRIPSPILEVHDGVMYSWRQRRTAPVASPMSPGVLRIHPTRVTSIPLIGSQVSVPAFTRGETDAPARTIRVTSPRASVFLRRLLDEIAHSGAHLHLIALLPLYVCLFGNKCGIPKRLVP